MMTKEDIQVYCRELSPPDKVRAVAFNNTAKNEEIIGYTTFLEKKILPRKVFIQGYQAMYHAAALFLATCYGIKIDEHQGSTHKSMRDVLDYHTRDSPHHENLMRLYEHAIEKFNAMRQHYRSGAHFADRVVLDLMREGYDRGKKITYYSDQSGGRNDPLELTLLDAELFIKNVVEPFLFIMEKLTAC